MRAVDTDEFLETTTGNHDVIPSLCERLAANLRERARPGVARDRILRALVEIEREIKDWGARPPARKRRHEVWSSLLTLNRETEELLSRDSIP